MPIDVTAMSRTDPARSRRLRLVVAAASAALVAALAPSSAAAEPSAGVAEAGELQQRAVERTDDYWTAKRMRNAEPAEVELADDPATPQDELDEDPVPQLAPIPYTSFELPDTTSYPNRVHGKVFFTKPGQGNYVCSGTVVNSPNDSTVITAGHCVNDNGVWATNFAFVPGYRNGSTPFGVWAASALYASQPWVQSENLRYDVGAAVIARNPAGEEVEDVVGARGIAFNQPADQFYRSHGYPAASPFDGSKLWACESEFGWFDTGLPGTGPATMAIGCDMTGGSSGGGWVIHGQDVVSLNSYKYLSQTEVMYGPYFGSTAEAVFQQASGAAPGASAGPVTPPPAAQPAPLFVKQCKVVKRKRGKKKAKGAKRLQANARRAQARGATAEAKRLKAKAKRAKKKAKRAKRKVCWTVRA